MRRADDFWFRSLVDIQSFFNDLYGQRNRDRFGTAINAGLSSMWFEVVQHAGSVAKGIRKEDDILVLRSLPKVFCWYCSFCTKCQFSLDDMLWRWFPLVCPTCYKTVCECGKDKFLSAMLPQKEPASLAALAESNRLSKPNTLDGYVDMFRTIYGQAHGAGSINDIFLHLTEELGEVAERIQQLKHAHELDEWRAVAVELESELADVFSWIAKLTFKTADKLQSVQQHLSSFEQPPDVSVTLSGLVSQMYSTGCPDCLSFPCIPECPGWIGVLPSRSVVGVGVIRANTALSGSMIKPK